MNIKPDIIIIWPTYFDFPGFRLQLQRDRQYFNRVIIGFNYDNYNDFLSTEIVPFIQREMKADPNAVCISPDEVNNYPSAYFYIGNKKYIIQDKTENANISNKT